MLQPVSELLRSVFSKREYIFVSDQTMLYPSPIFFGYFKFHVEKFV